MNQSGEMIDDGVKRINDVVKVMLSNSRTKNHEVEEVYINEIMNINFLLVYKTFKSRKNIIIEPRFKTQGMPTIYGRSGELGRVFINLFENAIYSLCNKRDRLEGAGEDFMPELFINYEVAKDSMIINLRDNSEGIDESIIKNVFDPFYTTKPTGEGTGLGLSLVVDVICAHCGLIEVESEKGSYTQFKITLPLELKEMVA